MIDAITRALITWRTSKEIEFVLLDHVDDSPGFCVGSDVRWLANNCRAPSREAQAYLQSAYRLFHVIATYPKPYIAVIDGATFGHGLGLSINGQYRIATERSVISFPETGYGSIPDAGATRFLARLPCELGAWLALTGAPITGKDVLDAGFTTHYCPSNELHLLKNSLIKDGVVALRGYELEADPFSIDDLSEIQSFFEGDCIHAIRTRLVRGGRWAMEQARKIDTKSPLSSKIAMRQVRTGRFLESVDTALKIEYRILSRLMESRNFQEGVRAKYIDKDHCPHWRPLSLNRVTNDMVEKFFAPLQSTELNLRAHPQLMAESA